MNDCVTPIYLPASYKGIEFEVMSTESNFGRRGAEGEFPFGENTAYADLGRKIETHSIKGRFNGPDHVLLTNAFIAVCRSVGPGTLIHPTLGIITVACRGCKVSNEFIKGAGETFIDLDFVEANDFTASLSVSSLIAGIDGIVSSTSDSFSSNYDVSSVVFYERDAVVKTTQQAFTDIHQSFLDVLPIVVPQVVWTINSELNSARASYSTAISRDETLQSFLKGFSAIDTYGKSATDKYVAFRKLAEQAAKNSNLEGASKLCQDAVYSTVRILASAYMFRNAQQIVSKTLDEELLRMDTITAIILEEQQTAKLHCNDYLFIALRKFQASEQATLANAAYRLPPIISWNFNGGVPSLIAAHEIFNNAKRFVELEERNPGNIAFALGPVVRAIGTPT